MSLQRSLAGLLESASCEGPDKIAVKIPGGTSISYTELSVLSDSLRDRLWHMGVRPGDRVGFRLHKSIASVVSIFGILKCGAAYVPVDAESPASRGAYILDNCAVKALITESNLQDGIQTELDKLGATAAILGIETDSEHPLEEALTSLQASDPAASVPTVEVNSDDTAYILYTSGSTGNPKGVVLSHANALSFIDWCSEVFNPVSEDRFSSHAPFHFDLSILDIYLSVKHGATLVLIGEALGKDPVRLAASIANEQITVWYSTPSILSLLANYGKLGSYDYSSLRIILFAGEVFPIPQYMTLREYWKWPDFFNLYGPTETNVCTWYRVPGDRNLVAKMSSFPIGEICPPNKGMVVNGNDQVVNSGDEGELLVCGPNVMSGYWNLPEQNNMAFMIDSLGDRWYRTGDIVREESNGVYIYVSRRDRMVKRRGYRVELGEIEVALMKHADIREAAVVAVPDAVSGVKVWAYVSCKADKKVSVIALKSYAAKNLPPYMIPDVFSAVETLPRTSTDKIDYQTLKSQCN